MSKAVRSLKSLLKRKDSPPPPPPSPRFIPVPIPIKQVKPPREVAFDHTAYPHLLDLILEFASYEVLRMTRLTSKGLRGKIDALFARHIAIVEYCMTCEDDWGMVDGRHFYGVKLYGIFHGKRLVQPRLEGAVDEMMEHQCDVLQHEHTLLAHTRVLELHVLVKYTHGYDACVRAVRSETPSLDAVAIKRSTRVCRDRAMLNHGVGVYSLPATKRFTYLLDDVYNGGHGGLLPEGVERYFVRLNMAKPGPGTPSELLDKEHKHILCLFPFWNQDHPEYRPQLREIAVLIDFESLPGTTLNKDNVWYLPFHPYIVQLRRDYAKPNHTDMQVLSTWEYAHKGIHPLEDGEWFTTIHRVSVINRRKLPTFELLPFAEDAYDFHHA